MKNSKIYKYASPDINNMIPGDPKGSPDESFFKDFNETLVFIDEAFLSKLSNYLGKGKYLKFDRVTFSKNISEKQKLICKKIFLYIAPPFQGPNPTKEEEKRKLGYDKFIDILKKKGIIVREGRCQRLKINEKFEYIQKAVDVWLTMDLTNVPLEFPNIKTIILISSDSDFVPVIKNLEKKGIKTILYTYYEMKRDSPFSTSNELIKSVYKYKLLSISDFDNSRLSDNNKNYKNIINKK